jgi:5-methylcytosine-specific restriction endonuclease McrA
MNEYQRWREWMLTQIERGDGIGDLADDMRRDSPDVRFSALTGTPTPITTVFGFLRWVHQCRTTDRAVLQWVGIAYAAWPKHKKKPVSVGVRFRVFKRDNYRCQLCGQSARDGAVLELDHIVPRAKGGNNDMSNLQTLCWDCNRGKRDNDL